MTNSKKPINFVGFTPTEGDRQMVRAMMSSIEPMAPSDASLGLTIESKQGEFTGLLKVLSNSGRMVVEEKAESLEALLVRLTSSISVKIDDWKRERFTVAG